MVGELSEICQRNRLGFSVLLIVVGLPVGEVEGAFSGTFVGLIAVFSCRFNRRLLRGGTQLMLLQQ